MRTRLSAWIAGLNAAGLAKLPLAAALIAALCAVLSLLAVDNIPFLTNADRFVSDGEIAWLTPAEEQDPDIVIVAVTEDTLRQFQYREPIDRQFMADLLTVLDARGARAIGLDYLFDQPTEAAKDDALKRTIAGLKTPLRVSYTEASNVVTDEQLAYLRDFIPAGKRAIVNLATDQFDVARWVYPGAATRDGSFIMSFARALAATAGVTSANELIPIAWRGRPNATDAPFKEFPAHAAKFLPAEWFKNKIVLIGSDLSLTDRHRTPFATIYDTAGVLPGVVIQAHALSQLLHGKSAPYIGWLGNLLVGFLFAAIGAALGSIDRAMWQRVGAGMVLVAALWTGGGALFHFGGPLIALIAPTFAFAGAFWAMEALSGSAARQQREFIKGVFSHHVAPSVVEQLLSDPTKMDSLEGERREMTFLFTDVADFTTMSETVESRELARILNAYLDGMTEIVQQHGGMVDKFIGDAVFAIFNAPLDLPDHAGCAVRCALEMDRFSENFCTHQHANNIPFGRTRIGVHTGVAVVGNFGSRTRHNYTASGDAVNTASRLEGLNKHFGTRIGISETTRAQCHDIVFRPIASVVMKGKTTAIDVWEPLPADDTRQDFIARYCQAFAQLQVDAPDALNLFEALEAEEPQDPCVALHLERMRNGTRGVALVMTEK